MTEPSHAVFLSYAWQDPQAAQGICEDLREAGIEKIWREIHDCAALFIPMMSARTASRHEGYFRLEWARSNLGKTRTAALKNANRKFGRLLNARHMNFFLA